VNNAGVMPLPFIEELRIDEWNRMIDVNPAAFCMEQQRFFLSCVSKVRVI
jgi:NADP-dependent 3-hydroxy acid dehydrogenase YdfG